MLLALPLALSSTIHGGIMVPEQKHTTFGVVYLIRNAVNGKVYVGKTTQELPEYFRENQLAAIHGSTRKTLLYRAIRKYGAEAFSIKFLDHASRASELSDLEKVWIARLQSCNSKFGYNLTTGGTGGAMVGEAYAKLCAPKSDSHRRKISANARLRGTDHMRTPEARAKKSRTLKGRTFSPETIERMRISAIKRCADPQWRLRQSEISKRAKVPHDSQSGKFVSKGDPTGTERRA
jgi:group I intron endonuclease